MFSRGETVHHGEKRKLTTRRQTRQSSYSGYETRSQDFRLSKFVIYKEIQTINTLMRDYCTASVKAPHEPIIFTFHIYLKGKINMNEHQNAFYTHLFQDTIFQV